MAECNLDVKIGTNGDEKKEQYSTIDFVLELSQ